MVKQYVFSFEEGDGKNKMLLGGKGANLCEMTQIGLTVPPGFTVTTEACLAYLEKGNLPDGLWETIKQYMKAIWRRRPARASAAPTIRCWSRCAPARRCPCRA